MPGFSQLRAIAPSVATVRAVRNEAPEHDDSATRPTVAAPTVPWKVRAQTRLRTAGKAIAKVAAAAAVNRALDRLVG